MAIDTTNTPPPPEDVEPPEKSGSASEGTRSGPTDTQQNYESRERDAREVADYKEDDGADGDSDRAKGADAHGTTADGAGQGRADHEAELANPTDGDGGSPERGNPPDHGVRSREDPAEETRGSERDQLADDPPEAEPDRGGSDDADESDVVRAESDTVDEPPDDDSGAVADEIDGRTGGADAATVSDEGAGSRPTETERGGDAEVDTHDERDPTSDTEATTETTPSDNSPENDENEQPGDDGAASTDATETPAAPLPCRFEVDPETNERKWVDERTEDQKAEDDASCKKLQDAVAWARQQDADRMRTELTPNQRIAGREEGPWLGRMFYGSCLEGMVAEREDVGDDPNIIRAGRPGQPEADFVLRSGYPIDITTNNESTMKSHVAREYIPSADNLITYDPIDYNFINRMFR